MGKKKRTVPSLNSSSTADIAFLLLIFFLLTTSMDTDKGLARQLPPPVLDEQQKDEVIVKERNVLVVLLNSNNQLLVGGSPVSVKELRAKAKEFIVNPTNDPNLPERSEIEVEPFGTVTVTKQSVISLMNDRGTSYQAYMEVQNELVAAYNELRDEFSKKYFQGKIYNDLSEDEQKAVRTVYPQKISEAEPKNYGGKK